MHWLEHLLGIDTQQSPYYDFWSGVATQASLLFAAISIYKHHNCRVKWCVRVGKYKVGDYLVCQKHHPEINEVRLEHIMFAHKKGKK